MLTPQVCIRRLWVRPCCRRSGPTDRARRKRLWITSTSIGGTTPGSPCSDAQSDRAPGYPSSRQQPGGQGSAVGRVVGWGLTIPDVVAFDHPFRAVSVSYTTAALVPLSLLAAICS